MILARANATPEQIEIVMAEHSSQDVVNQVLSADASASADVSVAQTTNHAALAVSEENPTTNDLTSKSSGLVSAELRNHNATPHEPEGSTNIDYSAENVNGYASAHAKSDLDHISNGVAAPSDSREGGEEDMIQTVSTGQSVESDTDTSRVDTGEIMSKDLEGQDQIPRYTVKKSASFKPVSVTKSFLAKAGTASTPVGKPGTDKGLLTPSILLSGASQSAARPRLVAKSGSSNRLSASKSLSTSSRTSRAEGPDPNQVWNRNRVAAAPQATPKHLTDEELRQQYGIQLASLPVDDGDSKEAKWADIDDDEDDWAPEIIEWNDGTKINLAEVEIASAREEQQAAAAAVAAAAAAAKEKEEAAKARAAAVKPPTTIGPRATVLKLGASSQPKTGGGLVLKSTTDKPGLVAKPPSSAPVKSPWATIPAVDKVPSVAINPPTQAPPTTQPRFGQRDIQGIDSMPPPPVHAKEIAADDFSRFSRDAPGGVPRELYNSQSGRYEPVNENRRGSTRKDQAFRQPSVLQRPSQGQSGHAEPSPAFQTSRAQQEHENWGRRRGSSNVSGESGMIGRRMSIDRFHESIKVSGGLAQQRQGSQAEYRNHARLGQRDASPAQSNALSTSSQSPTVPTNQPLMNNHDPTQRVEQAQIQVEEQPRVDLPQEDRVAVQKKLMHEKREAAIKRKQEEEAREEAERRERIRIKMEKLGLSMEKPGKDQREKAEEVLQSPSIVILKDIKEVKAVAPPSPPKPPIPNASGLPQQYGMIKVHASPLPNGINSNNAINTKLPEASPAVESKSVTKAEGWLAQVNGSVGNSLPPHHQQTSSSTPELDCNTSPTDPKAQPWSKMQQPSPTHSPWNNPMGPVHTPAGSNVWGPPANHRALGNGDFQNSMQRTQLRQPQSSSHVIPPHLQLQPQPIGTPRNLHQMQGSIPSTFENNDDPSSGLMMEESQTIPTFPAPESLPRPPISQGKTPGSPSPLPYSRSTAPPVVHSISQLPAAVETPKTGLSAWAHFGANSAMFDAERNDRIIAARVAEEVRPGNAQSTDGPTYNEVWKQVKRGDEVGQRHVVATTSAMKNQQAAPGDVLRSPGANTAPPPARSRYQDLFEQNQRAVSIPMYIARPSSPSTPPPDSHDHPVYGSVSERPLVNLPGSKPKFTERPVVRLPPPKMIPPQTPVQHPVVAELRGMPSPLRGPVQPLAMTATWQDRFNGLFDRKSPEKRFADVVDFSTSKVPLEHVPIPQAAAVTLPRSEESVGSGPGDMDILTKNVEDEDALFEERDFGSVPIVNIPKLSFRHDWRASKDPQVNPRRAKALSLSEHHVLSHPVLTVGMEEQRGQQIPIIVRIDGMSTQKIKMMTRPGAGTARQRHQHPKSPRGKPRANNRSREHPATHATSASQANAPTPHQAHSGNAQMPSFPKPHVPVTWARAVSGAV